ncbi:hypothetical protein BDQ17DRAFT_1434803 [Cyathus striatus]|nr:hypothetical protein BDQ17DRAFT_1434803 [Cyathus striatus]
MIPNIKEQDRQIQVFDTSRNIWIMRGRYSSIRDAVTIEWHPQNQDLAIFLAATDPIIKHIGYSEAPSAVSTNETSAHSKSEDNKSSYSVENTQIGNKLSPRERTIVSIYEVDQSLLGLTGKWSIQEAWKVYSEVNRVKRLVDINSKPLPDGFAKPSSSDIYKLFGIGTTAWHNWDVVLKRLSNYPDMAEWLSDNNPDMNNTRELWGLEKSSGFTRVNLEDWMDARDKANKDKAAGKEKASDSKQKSAKGKDKAKSKKGAEIKNK